MKIHFYPQKDSPFIMFVIYLTICLIILSISYFPQSVLAAGVGSQTTVKANIPGKFSMNITGFASADAIIQVTGVRIFAQTQTDKNGYFELKQVAISQEAKEICLIVIDSEKRASVPHCLSLPATAVNNLGPVIMPPTLSLSEAQIWQKQKAFAAGRTIPNIPLEISIFEVDSRNLSVKIGRKIAKILFPQVRASELPILNLVSDRNGNFTFTLPTFKTAGYRLFAKTIYKDKPGHKSNTISYKVESRISYFFRYTLPWMIAGIFLLLWMSGLLAFEYKTKKISVLASRLTDKRLKPFAIRTRLRFRRLWYNFREYLRSRRR